MGTITNATINEIEALVKEKPSVLFRGRIVDIHDAYKVYDTDDFIMVKGGAVQLGWSDQYGSSILVGFGTIGVVNWPVQLTTPNEVEVGDGNSVAPTLGQAMTYQIPTETLWPEWHAQSIKIITGKNGKKDEKKADKADRSPLQKLLDEEKRALAALTKALATGSSTEELLAKLMKLAVEIAAIRDEKTAEATAATAAAAAKKVESAEERAVKAAKLDPLFGELKAAADTKVVAAKAAKAAVETTLQSLLRPDDGCFDPVALSAGAEKLAQASNDLAFAEACASEAALLTAYAAERFKAAEAAKVEPTKPVDDATAAMAAQIAKLEAMIASLTAKPAVEPVAVEPVAVEPVAVEPVAVEPVAKSIPLMVAEAEVEIESEKLSTTTIGNKRRNRPLA